ncbi:hypothetical protein KIH23_07590 [Flavobacterium sp. CYK-55]|uniref:DUF6252 family protein n=1 Tax=Flavobacterium sp. CYK-55 TaxID=2835529 RepID=UPI001BD0CC79|nr:DUF6252 family protein [Flavobacterium sp. CYK-55]MBS7787158.1 hypothetical protein [Flavobacterium sp. CYK-55]
MKKFLFLFTIIASMVSCGEDISVSNYAVFRGDKDNGAWQGGNAKAILEIGNKLTIQASTLNETVAIKIPAPTTPINPKNAATFVKYPLGTTLTRKAIYTFTDNSNLYTYETGIGSGDGEVVISQYDGNTISGTFRFNAVNTDPDSLEPEMVNFQNGVFYKVPLE